MIRNLSFVLLLLLSACSERSVYINKSEGYKLVLKKDQHYKLKRPALIRIHHEKGIYTTGNDSVLLKFTAEPQRDSIAGCSYRFNNGNPDSVVFIFTDIHDSIIDVTFSINGHPALFKTEKSGTTRLAYPELIRAGIISADRKFHSLTINYRGTNYHYRETLPLSGATEIRVSLNQYAGKKEAVYYSKHPCTQDSVMLQTRTWKGIPETVVLKRK